MTTQRPVSVLPGSQSQMLVALLGLALLVQPVAAQYIASLLAPSTVLEHKLDKAIAALANTEAQQAKTRASLDGLTAWIVAAQLAQSRGLPLPAMPSE